MAPKSLLDCPQELQLSVLDLLSPQDLKRLCLVSRFYRGLAEPRLYSDIVLTWTRNNLPPLVPLLRSILYRPELGQAVRSLRLDGICYSKGWGRHDCDPPPLPVSALPTTTSADYIQSTGLPHADRWLKGLQDGKLDPVVALLVSLLPRLASLHLNPDYTVRNFDLGELFRSALQIDGREENKLLPKFGSLRHVTFAPRTLEWLHPEVNNTADVLPFFCLPAIQSLCVSIDNPKEWPFEISPSSLTSLELFRLRETRFGPLFAQLVSLKRLHWHCNYWEHLDRHASMPFVDLDMLVQALQHVSSTLTDLSIEVEAEANHQSGDIEPPEMNIHGSLRGLEKFDKIEDLFLPWAFLMGLTPDPATQRGVTMAEVLPRGLKALTLTEDLMEWSEYYKHGEEIQGTTDGLEIKEAVGLLPKLTRVTLPTAFENPALEHFNLELRRISEESGINLSLEDLEPHSPYR